MSNDKSQFGQYLLLFGEQVHAKMTRILIFRWGTTHATPSIQRPDGCAGVRPYSNLVVMVTKDQ